MKKTLAAIFILPFALTTGGVWGVAASKITRGKEPWFTVSMLCGLAITIAALSWFGGVSSRVAAYTFLGTGCTFVALRSFFGKGSAIEMFVGPHLIAVLLLLLWPALERAKQRQRDLHGPNHSVERTGASRLAQSQFVHQWRLAPAAHADRYAMKWPFEI
jgi:hypothetical protein